VLDALREDALARTDDGFVLRLSLPWIRSLPLAALTDLEVSLDGGMVPHPVVALGDRRVDPSELFAEPGWWFVQDRLVVHGRMPVAGVHDVRVAFRLTIPYLQIRPDGPLTLPFLFARALDADSALLPSVSRDVA
jgi:hypothetical protein